MEYGGKFVDDFRVEFRVNFEIVWSQLGVQLRYTHNDRQKSFNFIPVGV